MTAQIDIDDPRYAAAAAEILRRHNEGAAEANITSAVRDFLILTGLAESHEIVEEAPPARGSGSAVDLTALNTFVESKRRIGTTRAFEPHPDYVLQLDDYLAQSEAAGTGVRMGILTDGKHWLLRWPNAGEARTVSPYAFTLESSDRWFLLYEWLRDKALGSERSVLPTREVIAEAFGPNSPLYERDIAALRRIYQRASSVETVRVKRRLWRDLLLAALGEIARTEEEMDDLFVRHTYLSAVIGMVVQASFGVDIYQLAGNDPADLLLGRRFQQDTGLAGIVESDFFAWPLEVGGLPLVKAVADRVARFDWRNAPGDIAAILYETVIPPDERRQLGEYYTPHWLARTMVREVVTDPLDQHVLDPACGSGTFISEAVTHFITAAQSRLEPIATLDRLRSSVTGIDVHPVAVHLARAAWVLAAKSAIQQAADAGYSDTVSVPIYLGDALQLRFQAGEMFAEHEVRISVEDERNTALIFPVSLVERANDFDALMSDVGRSHRKGRRPQPCLGRPPRYRSRRAPNAGGDHLGNAAAARRRPQPHLGLLHPQSGAARRLGSRQGGCHHRQPALADLPQHRQHLAHRAGAAEQGHLRHLGRRQARQPPGYIQPVLRPLHRLVSKGWRSDRHGAAPQRPSDRPVRQMAHRQMALETQGSG